MKLGKKHLWKVLYRIAIEFETEMRGGTREI
jgi:hypothetical protein